MVAVVLSLSAPAAAAVGATDRDATDEASVDDRTVDTAGAQSSRAAAPSLIDSPSAAVSGDRTLAANGSATATDGASTNRSGTPPPSETPAPSSSSPTESVTSTDTATRTATATETATTTSTGTRAGTATDRDAATASPSARPAFSVSNVTAPGVVRAGDEVVVTATVTNPTDVGRTERVNYSLAGRTVASERLSLAAGESASVTFRTGVTSLEPATYVHGVRNATGDGVARRLRVTPDVDLAVRSVEAPTELSRDDPYVVLATVENPAETAITRNVSYRFDGVTVATKRVTVDGGASARVAYEFRVDEVEAAVGPITNGSTHTHGVVTGDSRKGGEVLIRPGAGADPSSLAVESFRSDDDVRPNGTLRVNVTVLNVDQAAFDGQVTYRIGGAAVDTERIRVPVGERRTLSFAVTHDALARRGVLDAPGETDHGLWVGDVALQTRPVSVHGPFETPTETSTVTFTDTPDGGPGTDDGSAATTPDDECDRGLFSPCGGLGMDETTLTLIGIATSVLGIVYEMVNG